MALLGRIGILTKVLIALGLMTVLTVAVTLYCLSAMGGLSATYNGLVQREIAAANRFAQARDIVVDSGRLMYMLVAESDFVEAKRLGGELDGYGTKFEEQMSAAEQLVPQYAGLLNPLRRSFANLLEASAEVRQAKFDNKEDLVPVALDANFRPAMQKVRAQIGAVVDQTDSDVAEATQAAEEVYVRVYTTTLIVALAGAALCMLLAVVLVRSGVTRPIGRLVAVMGQLADGDVEVAIVGTEPWRCVACRPSAKKRKPRPRPSAGRPCWRWQIPSKAASKGWWRPWPRPPASSGRQHRP
jgi:methyl-accepting chemotaxis protein